MSRRLGLLRYRGDHPGRQDRWREDLTQSLMNNSPQWVGDVRARALSKHHAWELLSWVEVSAPVVVREERPELVELAAFAVALLEHSPLDRRDVQVVASLVRIAAEEAQLDFLELCRAGLRRADGLGKESARWLPRTSAQVPPTHTVVGEGRTFDFQRVPPSFDPAELEQRLLAEQRNSRRLPHFGADPGERAAHQILTRRASRAFRRLIERRTRRRG